MQLVIDVWDVEVTRLEPVEVSATNAELEWPTTACYFMTGLINGDEQLGEVFLGELGVERGVINVTFMMPGQP